VGIPNKPDRNSKTGYRDTARPITKEFRAELTEAEKSVYHVALEKLQARTAAVPSKEKPSIQKQLADGGKQAVKENAARPAHEKSGKVKNAER
jgi:ATP phosphoribosyltransferase